MSEAFGESRSPTGTTPTTFRFTGQREQSEIGLYFYNARWYDSSLGRFTSPDTIVPGAGNPLAWDRFAYTLNNPVRYTDPSGHGYCSNPSVAESEICEQYDPDGDGYIELRKLEDWETDLLVLAVIADSLRGTVPDNWMSAMARVFLNRVTFTTSSSWGNMWEATFGRNSAFHTWFDLFTPPDLVMDSNLTADDIPGLTDYLSTIKNSYNPSILRRVEEIIGNEITNWSERGPDITEGGTDFWHAKNINFDALMADLKKREEIQSGYNAIMFGPVFISHPYHLSIALFTDNNSIVGPP